MHIPSTSDSPRAMDPPAGKPSADTQGLRLGDGFNVSTLKKGTQICTCICIIMYVCVYIYINTHTCVCVVQQSLCNCTCMRLFTVFYICKIFTILTNYHLTSNSRRNSIHIILETQQ